MVVFSKNGDTGFDVEASSQVRIPFNGSEIFIDGFFRFGSVSPYYSIVAGIGRGNGRTYLIGRALSDGAYHSSKQEGGIQSYRCREIGGYYAELVKDELRRYKKENGLEADILLWEDLSRNNHHEQKRELPITQLTFESLRKELVLPSVKQ